MLSIDPLLGGSLIGVAAAALLLLGGKIAGISGIAAGVLSPLRGDVLWRVAFVGGLVAGGLVLRLIAAPEVFASSASRSSATLLAAGLLVGLGTRVGNGCTSGHGVCGIGRLSPRSMVATVTFVVAGAVSVGVTRALLGGVS